jgi:hypothetical protein
MANCRSCKKEIIWLRLAPTDTHPNPKSNPIDAAPHADGTLVIDRHREIYRFATGNEKEMAKLHGKKLYISHFDTCPDAARFRTGGDEKKKATHTEPLFGDL